MSHTTTLSNITITNATAIRRAVEDLRQEGIEIELIENAIPRMYYQHQAREVGKCDFVLKLPKSQYDVGLKWNSKSKEYDVFLDTWAQQVSGQIGATCPMPSSDTAKGEHAIGRFTQRYGLHAAKIAAFEQGYDVIGETIDDDGNIQLQLAV